MTCGHQFVGLGMMNFVVEDNLCCLSGAIEDVYSAFHAVQNRLNILERKLYKRCEIAVSGNRKILQPILCTESFAGIFKI